MEVFCAHSRTYQTWVNGLEMKACRICSEMWYPEDVPAKVIIGYVETESPASRRPE
jgi:hypothetical protein